MPDRRLLDTSLMKKPFFFIVAFFILIFNSLSFALPDSLSPIIEAIEDGEYRNARQQINRLPADSRYYGYGLQGVIEYLEGDYDGAMKMFEASKNISTVFLAGHVLTCTQKRDFEQAAKNSAELPVNNIAYNTISLIARMNNSNITEIAVLIKKSDELCNNMPAYHAATAVWGSRINNSQLTAQHIDALFKTDYYEGKIPLTLLSNKIYDPVPVIQSFSKIDDNEPYIEVVRTEKNNFRYTLKGVDVLPKFVEYKVGEREVSIATLPPFEMHSKYNYSGLCAIAHTYNDNNSALITKICSKVVDNAPLDALETRTLSLIFPDKVPKGWLQELYNVSSNNLYNQIRISEAQIVCGTSVDINRLDSLYKRAGSYSVLINSVYSGNSEKKQVALTFDDGPNPLYVPMILETLKKYNAKATFFCVGKMVDKYPELMPDIINDGHEIANHSYTHPNITKIEEFEVIKELLACRLTVRENGGGNMLFFRPPGGNINIQLQNTINSLGFSVAYWSINAGEFSKNAPDVQVELMMKKVKNGSVLLLHNGTVDGTSAFLEDLLGKLTTQGYGCVTMSEIIK